MPEKPGSGGGGGGGAPEKPGMGGGGGGGGPEKPGIDGRGIGIDLEERSIVEGASLGNDSDNCPSSGVVGMSDSKLGCVGPVVIPSPSASSSSLGS